MSRSREKRFMACCNIFSNAAICARNNSCCDAKSHSDVITSASSRDSDVVTSLFAGDVMRSFAEAGDGDDFDVFVNESFLPSGNSFPCKMQQE